MFPKMLFNNADEEVQQEMQIGFPTDVRHVAHFGWDGSTANSPSWVNKS